MIEGILIFIIFLGPLVFFHELGHFFFARLFGVRVEVFSIGFGPKILSFVKGGTKYALSLIPLGGYVKMFGDNPLSEEELTPEEEKVAFTRKSKWARFWIVFGGPLANFILAFFIYLALVGFGEKLPQTKFGKITNESVFKTYGVKTGDILTKINEQEITSFDDFNLIDSKVNHITVLRDDEKKKLELTMDGVEFVKAFGKVSRPLKAPLLVNPNQELFLVRTMSGEVISLEEIFESTYEKVLVEKFEGEADIEFHADKVGKASESAKVMMLNGKSSWAETFAANNLYPKDLYIKNIQMNSAASKAGIKKGDLIISIEGNDIYRFEQLQESVSNFRSKDKDQKNISLTLLNSEGKRKIELTPKKDESIEGAPYLIGVETGISFYSFMVEKKAGSFLEAIQKALSRTKVGFIKTLEGFKKLIVGEVSLKHVGGPIAIGQVATDSFNISLSMFFRLMAIISINLGIINLFPIPVLDGGHIVFIFLELINRGPLSKKKLMYAQQLGMSLLFLLIFVALFNDISRIL